MVKTHALGVEDWRLLREVRLGALRDSPHAFVARWEDEARHSEQQWRMRLRECTWLAAFDRDAASKPVGLIALEEDADTPTVCHLGSLWVAPGYRRSGVGTLLIDTILEVMSRAGVATASLWVLDGNAVARALYERMHFVSTGERQQVRQQSSEFEERMRRHLY